MFTWARRIALALGFLAMIPLILTAVPVLFAKFTGSTPYTVMSASMAPTMQPGDIVIISPVADPAALQTGDIIAYIPPESTTPITHRIVDVTSRNGQTAYQTKGDANPIADNYTIVPGQIIGQHTDTIPGLGRFLDSAHGPLGWFIMFGLPLMWFLIAWAIGRIENAAAARELEQDEELQHDELDGHDRELAGAAH